MNPKAVPQVAVNARFRLASLGLVVVAGLVSLALAGTAIAAPIGKDGQIHACYRVKGKAKGAMRVTPPGKRCKRGERKLAWSVAGPAGPQGASGAQGGQGTQGSAGSTVSAGSSGSTGAGNVALETKVASLTLQVETLEGILDGVTNDDLTETINGLPLVKTGLAGLTSDVTGLTSDVGDLCTQATALTSQSNLLGTAIAGLSLNGALTVIGGLLNIPALPAALPAFSCPS